MGTSLEISDFFALKVLFSFFFSLFQAKAVACQYSLEVFSHYSEERDYSETIDGGGGFLPLSREEHNFFKISYPSSTSPPRGKK